MMACLSRLFLLGVVSLWVTQSVRASDEFEQAPIHYSASTPDNPVSRFHEELKAGKATLKYEEDFGYLRSLLEHLQVPVDSQLLVFSKTSLQIGRISPKAPRSIFFNDDVYVGYAHGGDMIEISVADPGLGAVFYTLDQSAEEPPVLLRQMDRCLTCHATTRTEHVPGHLARSLHVDSRGHPIFSAGNQNVDHRTPIAQRWGGWYVTGTHGKQTHLGNFIAKERSAVEPVDNSAGQNVIELGTRFPSARALTPHSDIVALMVFEHQLFVQNRLTKANFAARQALHYQSTMSAALGKSPDSLLESVDRRLNQAARELVEALLFSEEATLSEPISGTSGFANRFTAQGPHDNHGRSLKQLDLQTRLFKYPCSYEIYSSQFDALPPELLRRVWEKMHAVLTGADDSEDYAHLIPADRQAILEILLATKENLPDNWRSKAELP